MNTEPCIGSPTAQESIRVQLATCHLVSGLTGYVRCYPAETSTGIHDDCNRGSRRHVKFHGISSCPHLWTAAVFRHSGAPRGTHFTFLCADQPNLHASGVFRLRWSVRQCSFLGDQVSLLSRRVDTYDYWGELAQGPIKFKKCELL